MTIINNKELEEAIIIVEKQLTDYTSSEKLMILSNVQQRIIATLQKAKISDSISENPLAKFANKLLKDRGEKDEDEE